MELALVRNEPEVARDPLFPDDGEPWTDTPLFVQNTMDVTRMIQAIRGLERQVELHTLQDQESRAFYADRKRRCEERMGSIKASILGFLHQEGLKNIQTPAGTAYQRSLTQRQWPDDATLLAWATSSAPQAIRVKQEVDKRAAVEHIRATGEIPEGFVQYTETKLYLK
jgi:hypothetical protein